MVSRMMTLLLSGALCLAPVRHLAAEEPSAKEILEQHGIRVLKDRLQLESETELSKSLRDVTKLRRTLIATDREETKLQQQKEAALVQIQSLEQEHTKLSGQLANIDQNNVALNNKLVGALNAIRGQLNQLNQGLKQHSERLDEARKETMQAREAFVQLVLDMRQLADTTSAEVTTLAENSDVQTAIAELNKSAEVPYELALSRSFTRNVLQLEKLEESILIETIPLRKTAGDSFYASVVIGGEHTAEMIVDSGASLMTLPLTTAREVGIEPSATDPQIQLKIANGDVISARMVVIPEVRVGKFVVEDVECAVLGAEATDAAPLLGMSYLGKFKFELNAQESTLKLVDVESQDQSKQRNRRTR